MVWRERAPSFSDRSTLMAIEYSASGGAAKSAWFARGAAQRAVAEQSLRPQEA
jgi:hypothetical protein